MSHCLRNPAFCIPHISTGFLMLALWVCTGCNELSLKKNKDVVITEPLKLDRCTNEHQHYRDFLLMKM